MLDDYAEALRLPKLYHSGILHLANTPHLAKVAALNPLVMQMGLAAMGSPTVLAVGKMLAEPRRTAPVRSEAPPGPPRSRPRLVWVRPA